MKIATKAPKNGVLAWTGPASKACSKATKDSVVVFVGGGVAEIWTKAK